MFSIAEISKTFLTEHFTPLYNTDIIPLTSRPTLTVMDDGDYFVIFDTSTGKISKILKTNIIMPALTIPAEHYIGANL